VPVKISAIETSDWVNAKINSKHGATLAEVEEVFDGHIDARWHVDATHGRRLLVTGVTHGGRRLKIVLFPSDEEAGQFRLGTVLVASG
jgi:uncharacterized DUF497 family protein